MKAVNLIPHESRRTAFAVGGRSGGASYVLLTLLAVAVAFVTIDVLAGHTISDRRAKLAVLNQQATNAKALAAQLTPYTQFAQLAQARESTVREIAAARFDWQAALSDLSRVVPANTTLESLAGSVAPGAAGGGSSLRGDISSPAFELTGCSRTQDDVASLVTRLRLINGVSRVSLQDSSKSSSTGTPGSASTSGACSATSPSFNLVVWFQPLPAAGPDGLVSATSTPATTPASTTATTPGSTTATTVPTTTPATTPTTPTTTTGSTP